jgi:hypothetical protein
VVGSNVRVTVTNRAPELGTFQTSVWVGFHDGGFDIYDLGSAADTFFPTTDALERLAEDGNVEPIRTDFTEQAFGRIQGALPGVLGPDASGGQLAPGETVSRVFRLDPTQTEDRFFSYGTMIIPSNDAFSANGDPQAHPIFDVGGTFVATDFVVPGTDALDAGTEVNDEIRRTPGSSARRRRTPAWTRAASWPRMPASSRRAAVGSSTTRTSRTPTSPPWATTCSSSASSSSRCRERPPAWSSHA